MPNSTGLPALDEVLHGIQPGDNVVWRIDDIEEYLPFAEAFYRKTEAEGEHLVYFRFANHKPVLGARPNLRIYETHPEMGFENFITEIHKIIKAVGHNGSFIFDSLSDLSQTCYSDRMIGNFFKLTCPYLRELHTVAYFAMYRYYHSFHAAAPISETTQLLIDVYRYQDRIYAQPTKVDQRFSPTMYMLHEWEQDLFKPVKESSRISEVINSSPWPGLRSASYRMIGIWDKVFMDAERLLEAGLKHTVAEERIEEAFQHVLGLVISRDPRILGLAREYLDLSDIVHVWKRMIGTGMIGGKSIGLLLARAILKRHDKRWVALLEEHDSFFIGSDVFYTYLVNNDCWWERQRQKDPKHFLEGNAEVRRRILGGRFPDYIINRFGDMLDYYGQAPIIVRSSSLLEDNFGNAFAGKYDSVFCANQGTKNERLHSLMDAIRVIYASTISDEALNYRKNRGVLEKDEQMALLVQRVSGAPCGDFFFPEVAGVGFSFNPYAWSKEIDPDAGMLRLVFGLGTRAVNRSDDDYTRVVALNAPEKRPTTGLAAVRRHAQRYVDTLNLAKNRFERIHFLDLVKSTPEIPVNLYAVRDRAVEQGRGGRESPSQAWILTFDRLLGQTPFVHDMREMLQVVKKAYGTHVDVEFTANFLRNGAYRINLVQCRPLQVTAEKRTVNPIPALTAENIILRASGAIIGTSRVVPVDRIIYVVPAEYGSLPDQKRYAVARLIGKLSHLPESGGLSTILIGPGRWGTSTPALGIPVSFSEINTAAVLCEIEAMHESLVPDLSLGTHFFNEMVELDMLYIAYFARRAGNVLSENYLLDSPNRLSRLVSGAEQWEAVIRVIDSAHTTAGRSLCLHANSVEQSGTVYLD